MPFKKSDINYKCRWCDKPAKHNIVKGVNKGYCSTCGSKECLKKQYKDQAVNQKKKYRNRQIIERCKHCKELFIKESYNQKWCNICVPDKAARAIIQRYGISHPEYLEMLKINLKCPICWRKLDNPIIDHDHKTGKIRGMICQHCNTSLNVIEDKDKLKRALNYLNYGTV
jgi:hypothetical protein